MTQILLYGGLLAISVSLFVFSSRLRSPVGWLMRVVGASVFAIRFQHDPYAFPLRGNLLSGLEPCPPGREARNAVNACYWPRG